VVTACLLALFAPFAFQGGQSMFDFRDDFTGSGLHSRWTWHTPVPGPLAATGAEGLHILVPQREGGYDLWTGVHDAPLLTTPVPDEDFDYEGRIALHEVSPESHFHFGLIVGFGDRSVMNWGLYQSARYAPPPAPRLRLEITGQGGPTALREPVHDCYLRIEKRGDDYTFFWKATQGEEWSSVGSYTALFPPKFVGVMPKTFGNGPAVRADVRYLDLETHAAEPKSLTAAARIDPSRAVGQINPNIYGHFIEHLGRCIQGGIWAEVLTNRKFAGEASNNGVLTGWEAFNPGAGIEIVRDNVTYYTGEQSQRITFRGSNGERGLAQGGLDLRAGRLPCRLVARGRGLTAGVRVAIRAGEDVVAQHDVGSLADEWRTYEFELPVPGDVKGVSFTITSDASDGTIWLGCVSLMPEDNVHGMRPDVLEAIRAMNPPVVRWPGGNFVSGYHWRDGIGDRDRRPPRHDRAWDALEMNDFGTDDFILFCTEIGAEPYICVNAGEAMADEAADWAAYCNAPSNDRVGRERAANGHPDPYGVRYWSIGNEMYGGWQLGWLPADNYWRKAAEFAEAMRAVDKNIVLIANGVDGGGWGEWNAKVVGNAGETFDMLSVHFYQGTGAGDDPTVNYARVVASPSRVEAMLSQTADIIKNSAPGGKNIPIAFDEWNVWTAEARGNVLESTYRIRDGLFAAGIFHAMHRLSDKVEMGCLAQLVNVLGALRTTQTEVVKTPIALAFEMYGHHAGPVLVSCEVDSPEAAGGTPLVDVSATASKDGKTLYVAAINYHPVRSVALDLGLGGARVGQRVTMVRMAPDDFTADNPLGGPPEVAVKTSTIRASEAARPSLPPHSVTVFEFSLE
jgi:alpha-N-arabinofuranosidase